ncbi:hypothetical protein BHM03_00019024 [Ensete ventricosum]|nr:hypothetical protein BHM03_00019024 [Ensete ventricosum]
MSGGRSGCSRARDGCTTRSTTRSRISCSSGGCSTTNNRAGGEEAAGDREEMGRRSASLAVRCDIAGPISAKQRMNLRKQSNYYFVSMDAIDSNNCRRQKEEST